MSAPEPAIVTLRTGAEVPRPLVNVTLIALERLMDTYPVAVHEAVLVARDPAHVPFGNTGAALRELHLLSEDGTMHDATRDIILAATGGEDFDLRLVSPYPAPEVTK